MPSGRSWTSAGRSRRIRPGGYGTWRLATGARGQPDLIVTLDPIPAGECDHRLKQHPRWHVEQLPDGTFRWTTPSGRTCTTEPTRYPV